MTHRLRYYLKMHETTVRNIFEIFEWEDILDMKEQAWFVAALWIWSEASRPWSDASDSKRADQLFVSKSSGYFIYMWEKFSLYLLFISLITSVLTVQIKILMMKTLWMVTDLLLPVPHHPRPQQAPGERLGWGPPAGLDLPLLGPSLQVSPSPVWYSGARSVWDLPTVSLRSELAPEHSILVRGVFNWVGILHWGW